MAGPGTRRKKEMRKEKKIVGTEGVKEKDEGKGQKEKD